MTRRFLSLAVLSAAALTFSACTHNKLTNLPPGEYESSTKTTNAQGTTTSKSTTTEVEVDRHGNKSATQTTKTTTDPKGLFNKSTTTQTNKVYNN